MLNAGHACSYRLVTDHDARCHSAEAEKYDGLPNVIGRYVVGFGGFKHTSV